MWEGEGLAQRAMLLWKISLADTPLFRGRECNMVVRLVTTVCAAVPYESVNRTSLKPASGVKMKVCNTRCSVSHFCTLSAMFRTHLPLKEQEEEGNQ